MTSSCDYPLSLNPAYHPDNQQRPDIGSIKALLYLEDETWIEVTIEYNIIKSPDGLNDVEVTIVDQFDRSRCGDIMSDIRESLRENFIKPHILKIN